MPSFNEIWAWVFHVPSTYELLWWIMLVVVWYGFVIDRRTKIIQQQLDELVASKRLVDGVGVDAENHKG
jgi:hypothetical protein